MSVLPAEVHSALAQLLQGLQSTDNTARSAAEEQLNNEWVQQRPDLLLMGLAEQMQGANDESVSGRKHSFDASACERHLIKTRRGVFRQSSFEE